VKEELLIVGLGIAGTLADYATTKIGLAMPEILEMNPLANPAIEGAFAVGGSILVGEVGKALKVSHGLTLALMLVPASVPLIVATRNLIIIGTVNAGKYPINEFPLIYWR
jgi:hypothetical protein